MEIPTMKEHFDNAVIKLEEAWQNLLLEEKRDLPHIQNCNEAIKEIQSTSHVLEIALQREIGKAI